MKWINSWICLFKSWEAHFSLVWCFFLTINSGVTCLSVWLSCCMSFMPVLSVCLSSCLSVCLSMSFSVFCTLFCNFFYLSMFVFLSSFIFMSFFCPFVSPFVRLFRTLQYVRFSSVGKVFFFGFLLHIIHISFLCD